MWKCAAAIVVLAPGVSLALAQEPAIPQQPIVTSDLLRLRSVTAIDVAQDGSRAIFTVKSIAEAKPSEYDDEGEFVPAKYEYRSHLYLIDLNDQDSTPVQLTFGRRNDHSPRLAPDASAVVFVRSPMRDPDAPPSKDDDKEKPQVWLLPLTGGEARPLTDFKEGAESPRYSPLGNAVLVTATVPADEMEGAPGWPLERPGRSWKDVVVREEKDGVATIGIVPRPDGTLEEIRAWLEVNATRENPTVINRLEFQDELSLHKPFEFKQLFLVNLGTADPVKREDAVPLTSRFADHDDAEFLPNGRRIVFAAKPPGDRHIDRVLDGALWSVDIEGGEEAVLFALEGWKLSKPRPSIDGSLIAFLGEQQDEPAYRQTQLGLISTAGGAAREPVWLTDLFDSSVSGFDWMSARGSIVFGAPVAGAFPLFSISTGVIQPARLLEEAIGAHVFDVGGGNIVYSMTSASNPCVLMARTPRGERQIMNLNEWVHGKTISLPTEGWIDRPDGTRVQYWLMPPTNREEGRTYPLCLEIHGGPSAMWGPGEDTMWLEYQLLCSWGYGVVFCNPRGSGGYGYGFQKANHQNWGAGPAGDVLAAVDRAIQQPWVDREKLVVTGGSYAGYLTTWIIANDHRFKAAVAQRGVYDFTTFFGEGNAWRLVEWAMGGQPWESTTRAILQRESPFTHVRQIQTPLLIMHSSSDLRTGVSQSEMLYRALKVLDRPVEYIRYPDAGHDLSRTGNPHQRMDRLNRIIEFFERYASGGRGAPVVRE